MADPSRRAGATAEVVILPCIRREPMTGGARAAGDLLEQLQA